MRKYLVFIPVIIFTLFAAGILIWAQGVQDRADYPNAKDYAPNFWFDSEEKYYPADPLDFYYDKSGEEISGETAVVEYNKLSLDEKLKKVKVFYNVNDADDEIVYQYWVFYVMNNYENGHYGDWESVFVFVDKESGNINKVVGSAHGSGHVLKIKSEDTRHIWAYVGNGSHANCPDEIGDGNCDFWPWRFGAQGRDWVNSNPENGEKVIYPSYTLEKIEQSYIANFNEGESFNKDKSPILGVNLYKTFGFAELNLPKPKEDKYHNLPVIGKMTGQTPTFAWAKEEYHNPQKVLVSTRTKIANNVSGFFKNTGSFLASVGKRAISPVANLLTAQVAKRPTGTEIPDDPLSELTVSPLLPAATVIPTNVKTLVIARGQPPRLESGRASPSPEGLGGTPTAPEPLPSPDSFVDLPAEASAQAGDTTPKEVTEEVVPEPKPIVRIYEPPTTPAPSPDPIDLTAPTSTIFLANYSIASDQFTINWNTDAQDLAYYEMDYKIGSNGAWQDWGNATTTITSKNYLNATTNTYYFRVRGTDIHQNIGPWQESAGVVIDLYQVVINEIQVNDAEFVELYNLGSSTTTLAGYYFSYYPPTRTLWNDPFRNRQFLDSAAIPAGGYYLIGLKNYATSTGNPKADWQPYTSAQLSNEKGTIAIFPFDPTSATSSQYAYDNRVDAVGWGSGISLYEGTSTTTTPATGESLTRNTNHTDTENNSSDFTVATSTTPTNSNGETYVPPPPPPPPVPIWAMYQKDARHSGLATLAGPAWTNSSQATSTWIFPMDSTASSQPVIDGLGIVYAMDGEGKVYAINTNGTQKWKFDPKIQGENSVVSATASPALSSDGSFIYSTYTYTNIDTNINKLVVYSIKTSDGTFAWKYSPSENGYNQTFTSPVLDASGNIYVASNTKLYSISPSGVLRWEFTPTSQFSSFALWIRTPAIAQEGANEYAYITAQMSLNGGDRYIFKVDVASGIKVWHSVDSNMNTALLSGVSINATGTIYTGGYLFIGKSGLFAVNPADGSKIWSNNIGDSLASNIPSYDTGGNIFLGTEDTGNIGALHKTNATGTLLWTFTPDASPSAVQYPTVIDGQGRVYVGAKNKFVYALNPADGAVIWQYQLAGEPRGFAVGNGRVYVVSYDGKVYAL